MATVTVQNDTGGVLSFHPFGPRLAAGATLALDTEVDAPQTFNMARAFLDASQVSVTAGTMPSAAAIAEALEEFDVRSARAIEERTRTNELINAADAAARNALTDLGGYHNP